MANDKKKINELVVDDEDPTAELEVISFQNGPVPDQDVERESDADTFGFAEDEGAPGQRSLSQLRSDLQTRTRTIGRLQYDIEQLRAKWLGLETEIKAREKIVSDLSGELDGLRETVSRKDKLLKKRDVTIRSLKAEIRQRDETHRELLLQHAEIERQIEDHTTSADEKLKALRAAEQKIDELRQRADKKQADATVKAYDDDSQDRLSAQLQRTEQYADELRIKLKDLTESHDNVGRDRDRLAQSIAENIRENRDLQDALVAANDKIAGFEQDIENLRQEHQEELRMLRFELGEAQNTIAQTSDLNSQLTSDLLDTRGYKEELERMLTQTEEESQKRIDELEKDLSRLSQSADDYRQKLESKSAAINVLLNELTKKSEQIEAIGEIEEVIQDIDDRISERIDDSPESAQGNRGKPPAEREKITRLLIGSIGEQVLRFPLFKDRLTIGRTADNDIQLKLSYISRRHAVILTEGETTRVIDWGSKNGVYVNSQRIKEHFLANGDIVAVGNAKFRYEERRKRE